jgi:hypothetical protein
MGPLIHGQGKEAADLLSYGPLVFPFQSIEYYGGETNYGTTL